MSQATQLLSIVAADIGHVEDKMRSGISDKHTDLQAVVDYLVGAGGKRLRPALTLMAANFYPVDKEKSYALAAAVELLHTATLVHDDLIELIEAKTEYRPQLSDTLDAMKIDSLAMAELTVEIEKKFGIRIDDDVLDVGDFEGLVKYIERKSGR